MSERNNIEDQTELDIQKLKAKIIHVLSIYPKLNHSMLQVGLGPPIGIRKWKPVLTAMIAEGLVVSTEIQAMNHVDQFRTYTVLSLHPGLKLASAISEVVSTSIPVIGDVEIPIPLARSAA